jgi:hypothetical protein
MDGSLVSVEFGVLLALDPAVATITFDVVSALDVIEATQPILEGKH